MAEHETPKERHGLDDPEKSTLQLGIIGNCSFSALINQRGRIVWCCLPRLDSPPMFGRLLMGDEVPACDRGFFDVDIDNYSHSHQEYIKNTAILTTRLYSKDGSVLKITDFAPRFHKDRRWFCPGQFIRIITPEKGRPRVSVRCRPSNGYTGEPTQQVVGSNHISYFTPHHNTRLTSSIPVAFIKAESKFVVSKEYVMFFGVDEPFHGDLHNTMQEFFDATLGYWNTFSRNLQVPLEWQNEVIRAAITLKMCQLQSSGAIVAAMTTSIPEAKNTQRNWDYRFCWLRDSFHTIQALNQLGQTTTMEQYLEFIVNVASGSDKLQPLYGLLMETEVTEEIIPKSSMAGYRGMGPVRIGNQAYHQDQHDNCGNVILSVQQMFFDERLAAPGTDALFEQLEKLGKEAVAIWNTKDAGLWELRNSQHVHTFSAAVCWAACHRLNLIMTKLGKKPKEGWDWAEHAKTIRDAIITRAWDEERQCIMATLLPDKTTAEEKEQPIQRELDASVLLLGYLQFFEPTDEKFIKTVETVGKELMHGDFCFRYVSADDFGKPDNSFIVCTFWYIEALALIGRKQEARSLFQRLLKHTNHVGLFSEDISLKENELWGNFPQTYSMVGIINNAIRLSEPWSSIGL